MRAVIVLLILLTGQHLAAQESLQQRQQERIRVLQRISPSVVCVMDPKGAGGGSGVLISNDGFAVSNYHVTSGAGSFLKCGLNDGQVYDAVIVGIDPTGDVSLIQLLGRTDFPAATPGNSDLVRTGDEVLALGNPFLLASDFTPTVTCGIVSGTHRYQYPAGTFLEYTDCIQIDASINPGNSGGPLFDRLGNWIGINGRASFEKRGRVNSGAAYAISVNQVLLFVEHLKSGLIIDHGRTGFTAETSDNGEVVISQVSELSEAYRRGLRPGAILTTFADRPLSSANQLQNLIGVFPEGSRLPIQWIDDDGQHRGTIRLTPIHDFEAAPELPMERRQPRKPDGEEGTADEAETLPESITGLFEERRGYCNFHFNRLRTDEILQPLRAQPLPADAKSWRLELNTTGDSEQQTDAVIAITAETIGMRQGEQAWLQARKDPDPSEEPVGFPGLLTALGELSSFVLQREQGFDEVITFGETTHLPLQQKCRVLISRNSLTKSRWYFAEDQPWPVAVDVEYAVSTDEARLVFRDWQTINAVSFPRQIGVVDANSETITWLLADPLTRTGEAE